MPMIPANLTRSRSGCSGSSARACTRPAKPSQLNSRLISALGELGVTSTGCVMCAPPQPLSLAMVPGACELDQAMMGRRARTGIMGHVSSVTGQATGDPAGREGAADRQVFTSRLQGRPFMDSDGVTIGRVRDVVLLSAVGDEPPRVLGFVVLLRRRRLIFVGMGRVGEIDSEGAHLVGGTVDLDRFTLRPGEILASSLYGKQGKAGAIADIAIAPRELRRTGWVVTAIAVRHGRLHAPQIVSWQECRDMFDGGPLEQQLTSLREMAPADLATAFDTLPAARRGQLAEALDDSELADLLEELPEEDQVRLVNSLELERGADVVEEMQPDDAADLLAEMPVEQRERLLTAMRSVRADDVRRLLRYDK